MAERDIHFMQENASGVFQRVVLNLPLSRRFLGCTATGEPAVMVGASGDLAYFDLTGTNVSIAAVSDGSTNLVLINPATTFGAMVSQFDNGGSNNGQLRYTGTEARILRYIANISVEPASANDTFVFAVCKNGVPLTKVVQKLAGTSDVQAISMNAGIPVVANDVVALYVGNLTSAADINVQTLHCFAVAQ